MLAALAVAAVLQADPSPSVAPTYSYTDCLNSPGFWHGCPIPAPDISFLGNGQLFVSGPITERLQFTEYQNGHAAGTHNEILVRDYSLGAATLDGKRGSYVGLVTPCGGSTYYVYPGAYSETPPAVYYLTGHDEPTYIGCPSTTPSPSVSATSTAPAPSTTAVVVPVPSTSSTPAVEIGKAEKITAASNELPLTGDATGALVSGALVALLLGIILVAGSNRRRF